MFAQLRTYSLHTIPALVLAAAAIILSGPDQGYAQSGSDGYIIGFHDQLLKTAVRRGDSSFEAALKTIMPSSRQRQLSVKTVGRLKRNVVNSIARGKQSYLKFIQAKTVREPRAVNQKNLTRAMSRGLVRYVEPNIRISIAAVPNDPSFAGLWGMNNTKAGILSVPDVDINAPEAWDIFQGSAETVVAVVDTGIDPTTPDLKQNMWINSGEIAGNNIDDDQNGYVDDIYGCDFVSFKADSGKSCGPKPFRGHHHGTHVAGTIGARGDNGAGVAGVNWRVSLMSLAFLDEKGEGTLDDALEAVEYAVMMKKQYRQGKGGANIRVVNASFGHDGAAEQSEIDAIKALGEVDILFVAAAGNGGPDGLADNNDVKPSYPASYDLDNIISVAAVDQRGKLAYFSNYGAQSVDIAAPGVSIQSTVFNGAYESQSGTSMAAPHVAGVAALVFGHRPKLSAWEVKEILMASAKDGASLSTLQGLRGKVQSGGLIDAEAALILAGSDLSTARIVSDPQSQTISKGSKVTFSVRVIGGTAVTYQWFKGSAPISGARSASYTIAKVSQEDAGSYSVEVTADGKILSSRVAGLTVSAELQGDVDKNGKIDFIDLMTVFMSLGKTGADLAADVNKDGKVDLTDVQIIIQDIQKSQAGASKSAKR